MSIILDNYKHTKVGDFLKSKIKPNAKLSIVSAYFTIYAYEKMKAEFDTIDNLRFLFGEPTFIKNIDPKKVNTRDFKIEDDNMTIPTESQLSQKAIAQACAKWLTEKAEIKSMVKPNFLHGKMYIVDNVNKYEDTAIVGSSNFTVNGLGLGKSPNIELNVEIENYKEVKNLVDWFDELWNNTDGLVVDVKADVLKYIQQLYQDNDPEFVYLKTLYHVFYDYLTEQDRLDEEDNTEFYETAIWRTLYNFQKDGVSGIIDKMRRYNGCILADSVGLGKTYEALAVIKYYELRRYKVLVLCPKKLSENWSVYQAYKANKLNELALKNDDGTSKGASPYFNYTIMYHTDMGRVSGKSDADGIDLENYNGWSDFDLVVIDESHNFRGNPMEKINAEGEVRYNRAKWLMEKIIKSGRKTKVLLLSATPVNNSLRDLRNQIHLITEGKNEIKIGDINIPDLGQTLTNAQTVFTNWAALSQTNNRKTTDLLERLNTDFFTLLDGLTIARSRKHIEQFYDLTQIGKFPVRTKPVSSSPAIDTKGWFPSYEDLSKKISDFKLSVYNPSAFVKEAEKNKYGIKTIAQLAQEKQEKEEAKAAKLANKGKGKTKIPKIAEKKTDFDQNQREYFLIGMMKVNYLKRLESSVNSFEISLKSTIDKIENLLKKIETFEQTGKKEDIDVLTQTLMEDDGNDNQTLETPAPQTTLTQAQQEVGTKLKFDLADIDLATWKKALAADRTTLSHLYTDAKDIKPERDGKLAALKHMITEKATNPKNGTNKKVIIFTAYADTAEYLYTNIANWVTQTLHLHTAKIAGSDTKTTFTQSKNDFNTILTHFSPISKKRKNSEKLQDITQEIDILIATDCISEGQNLQDCDFLINYDIHWNPVRIIQRFGRIDRLGSVNDSVHLVNFWPTADLDKYLNLKHRVEARMALVDIAATGADNILDAEQSIIEELKYRDEQLIKLKENMLDLEDMSDHVSLGDFSMQNFRQEIRNYFQENVVKLRNAPLGLFATVPAPSGDYAAHWKNRTFAEGELANIKPGVIYCLKLKNNIEGSEKINALMPYFLVYVYNDGTIKYNYTKAQRILEFFKAMCKGETAAIETVCDVFNEETNQGSDMTIYTDLLRKAVAEIGITIQHKNLAQFGAASGSRSGGLFNFGNDNTLAINDFELITWLIIK